VLLENMQFPAAACPYKKEMVKQEAEIAHPTKPQITLTMAESAELTALLEEDAKAVLCSECGETLGNHRHPKNTGPATRSLGPRKEVSAHPQCPHCGGRIHWNDHGAKVNMECLARQMYVAEGIITDPLNEKLPVLTAADFEALGAWLGLKRKSGVELKYGKMESVAGGAATYSGLRKVTSTLTPTSVEPAFTAPEPAPAEPEPTPEESEEEAAARKLEEIRAYDRERKRQRRAALKNASRR
jgi:hypothetical protein